MIHTGVYGVGLAQQRANQRVIFEFLTCFDEGDEAPPCSCLFPGNPEPPRYRGNSDDPMRKFVNGQCAHWRPFADRPDHQRLAASHVAGREYFGQGCLVAFGVGPEHCRGHLSLRRVRQAAPDWKRPQKTHRQQAPGRLSSRTRSRELPAFCRLSIRHARQRAFQPCRSCPSKRFGPPRPSRGLQPSSWEEEVRSLTGPVRPDQGLCFSCCCGCGNSSNWVIDLAPWRLDVPNAIRARITPADHHHMLAGGEGFWSAILAPATTLFCCGRNSMAKCTPSRSRPAPAGRADFSAPPESTNGVELIEQLLCCDIDADVLVGTEIQLPRRTSVPCAGRSGVFPF